MRILEQAPPTWVVLPKTERAGELQPDVILVDSTPQTAALQRETRTIPIVFVVVSDRVGSGFVASLSRPGGNITGFSNQDSTMGGKWVELLSEIAPDRRRVAAMFNPETAPYVSSYYLPTFEAAARLLKVEPIVVPVHNDSEVETTLAALGRESGAVTAAGSWPSSPPEACGRQPSKTPATPSAGSPGRCPRLPGASTCCARNRF